MWEAPLPKQSQPKPPPRYHEIADELRAAITSGKYQPGDRIPGENQVMEKHKVARGTAREALAVLTREGLTEARRGAGVFVRTFKFIRRNATKRLSSSTWGRGRSVWDVDVEDRPRDVVDLKVTKAFPPERIAGCLGLTAGEEVITRSRKYRVEGRLVMLATSYIPADVAAGSPISEQDTGEGGIYARLADLGHAPARFREEIRVRMPGASEIEALSLTSATPVILIARTAFDAEGRPVEVNEMVLDSSSYLLEYDFPA